ncbi:hypothetical protein PanWU01x14_353580 [Parasponia andersonii]|uniref:Transmembrane protein n=1 Tax=Parasponia andersonii TaxID=3476 RepID=A0A2P5A9W3_PARAD|nr:hypothetical protein PanWU01x14_353580 [Parasponia andersonii]
MILSFHFSFFQLISIDEFKSVAHRVLVSYLGPIVSIASFFCIGIKLIRNTTNKSDKRPDISINTTKGAHKGARIKALQNTKATILHNRNLHTPLTHYKVGLTWLSSII